jgi:DNA-binding response OmpR family regulator
MTARLLIVEDDPEITSALLRGLALHGYDAQAENRSDRALKRLGTEEFSGAIVDVMLGSDSGIDLVRAARAAGATLPILMLSALSDVEHRAAGLEAGADDYVVKPFSFDELIARLRVQEHRAGQHRPGVPVLSSADRSLVWGEARIGFTEREFDLMRLLVEQAETPLPRLQIFHRLWGEDGSSSENVVDVYIGYLRKKLSGHDFGFEIKTVRNKGFCLTGRAPMLGAG